VSTRPPQAQIWDFLRGAMGTRALAVVADLGVADALAHGPRAVEEVARELAASADTLHRLLRALAGDGVFAEVEPGIFENTPASELLRSGEPMRDFAHLFGGAWYRAVGELTAETGGATFPQAFGADFWTWLADHPEERAAFDRAMEDGKERRVERLAAVDWRAGETVVDVGGGNGSLLVELLRRHPELDGIVLDLPETDRDEAAFGDRIEFVAASFFEGVPAGDVYLLGTVLHDWDDDHAAAILRTVRAAAPPHARVLIIDAVIPPGNEPQGAKWLDLLMLVLFHGRERTEAEWFSLLEATGFGIESIEDGLIQASCR
jgi:O-methyltransferase/methyltransferase family protein